MSEKDKLLFTDAEPPDDDDAASVRRVKPGDPRLREACPFCRQPYAVGDLIKEVPSGPINAAELRKTRRGLPYASGPPMELHYDCGDPTGAGHSN